MLQNTLFSFASEASQETRPLLGEMCDGDAHAHMWSGIGHSLHSTQTCVVAPSRTCSLVAKKHGVVQRDSQSYLMKSIGLDLFL